MRVWQVMALSAFAAGSLPAQEEAGKFAWAPIRAEGRTFSPELGMLDSEREQYATNFANLAVNRVAAAKATPASLEQARKLVSLALHLSPRNKRAVIVNFQFSQGTLPEPVAVDFSADAMARLLFTRAALLLKQEGQENQIVARMFTQLAAQLDPKNEEAVYASEVQRLDHGEIDWSVLTHAQAATRKAP
ncbi:MAG TPA: hypothetical protein VM511_04830 [Luteolibacter sp.]|nr:hypothetical protein [Luteolibacter sp.]